MAINYVKEKLKNWNGDGLVLDGEFIHIRCCAHIFNLLVADGMKDVHDSIASICNTMRHIRSSASRLPKFKKCCEHKKVESKNIVTLDVPTRWNSTYLILTSVLKF